MATAFIAYAGLLLSLLDSRPAAAQAGPECTVFIVGGTGRGAAPQLAHTLHAVRAQAAALAGPSTLVVLDDRLGRSLLPARRAAPAQTALLAQLHDFPGRLVVPGGTDDGRDARLAQLLATPARCCPPTTAPARWRWPSTPATRWWC